MAPRLKPTAEQIEKDKPLGDGTERLFRASAARVNYIFADRIDTVFASKEISRSMSSPIGMSIHGVEGLGRYFDGRRRLVYTCPRQGAESIDVHSDTDWAGCLRTRKSRAEAALCLGRI